MKTIKILSFAAATMMLAFAITSCVDAQSAAKKINTPANGLDKGFAVLELFTSEGCSSCPAADELLARIQQEAHDKPVYVLAYHVDYWNSLGWKDVFSNAQFSKRQKDYGRWMNNPQIYTPQVVVNGRTECVGSDEPVLRSNITDALMNTVPLANVTLQGQQSAHKLTLNYQVSGSTPSGQLLVAVVQKTAISKVARGENEGRTLTHAQIVRQLQTISLNSDRKGVVNIDLPQDFDTRGWEVVGFIQNAATGEILNVTKANLNTEPAVKATTSI